jgi:hypothetical protein
MKKCFALVFLFCSLLFSREQKPWFTGSLLAPVGEVVPYGDFMIRSYWYYINETDAYDRNWNVVSNSKDFSNITSQFQCLFGLTPWCNFVMVPQVLYNWDRYEQAVGFGDLLVGLDFQLLFPKDASYFPGIKFGVKEVFPTGKYQRFQPKKLFVAQSGYGAFATQLELVLYQIYRLYKECFLTTNFSAKYVLHTSVSLHGFNTYGGGFGTKGRVYPGDFFQANASFELSLTKHWALALDNVYIHRNKDLFLGNPGISFQGTYAEVGKPSSEEFSMAPAIEYNFSDRFGMIAGCWFSVFGRNTAQFRNAVLNLQYTY